MSKAEYYVWKLEDYRKLMLRSSRCEGEEYLKPLYDTDIEKWAELCDATRIRKKEKNYLWANIVTFILSVFAILFYHLY